MSTTTEVKERPILFSTEMVQAILGGRKTQTRRVIKPQPSPDPARIEFYGRKMGWLPTSNSGKVGIFEPFDGYKCPYGQPGDLLYVREAFCRFSHGDPTAEGGIRTNQVAYRADDPYMDDSWKPSIHMPKDIARIWLKVEDIRVERVKDISIDDVWAEGVQIPTNNGKPVISLTDKYTIATYLEGTVSEWEQDDFIKAHFAKLWDSINADRGYSWESNPWVWVVQFNVKEVRE